jgi:hypothetical protein
MAIDPNGVYVIKPETGVTNPDGSITYADGSGTFTTFPDGHSISSQGGLITTHAPPTDPTTGYPGPRVGTTVNASTGAPASAGEVQSVNDNINSIDWNQALKTGARSVKEATEKLNPIGTPGIDQNAVNGRIFGGAGATDPVFNKDGIGSVLNGVANLYGLGGLVNGTASGTGAGAGGAGGTNGSGIDTSPITAAAAAAKALQDKFLVEYNAAHPGQPPVMTAAQLPPAVQATMPEAIRPGHAEATLLDPTLQGQQRDKQLGLENTIQDAIDGKAPSVAQLQLQAALQTNEANQLGLASKASGGGNVALALRTAANNTGRLNQGASADAALLRAKEIADARAQLGGVLDQARGGDISLADKNASLATGVSTTNAGLDTQAAIAKANLDNATRLGNAQQQNTLAAHQGDLTNDASKTNVSSALDQERIDAAAKDAAAKNALTAGGQVITGTVGAAEAQAKAVAAAQAAKAAADAKQAAGLGALGTTLASWLKTPSGGTTSPSLPSGTTYGANGSPIID